MVNLVPSPESVMDILTKTEAYRKGHFIYPNGKHASHYFQMPLAFRYYDNARIMSVGLSRPFQNGKGYSKPAAKSFDHISQSGGIMVAFGVREALSAEQIYWAEIEDGKRQFRQYIGGDIHPAIIVDDILRSGRAMAETVALVKELGAQVIGIGAIVKFDDSPNEFDGVPVKSLMSFDVNFYETEDEWRHSRSASESEEQKVRY